MADNYLAPAAFINSQGTLFLMSLKKNCIVDSDKPMRELTDSGCIALAYDSNGAGAPNMISEDIIEYGGANIGDYYTKVGGYKIMEKPINRYPSGYLTKDQCLAEVAKSEEYGDYKITRCGPETDYWAYYVKYCNDKGWHMPNESQAIQIARGIFVDASGNHPTSNNWDNSIYRIDTSISEKLSLKSSNDWLLTGHVTSDNIRSVTIPTSTGHNTNDHYHSVSFTSNGISVSPSGRAYNLGVVELFCISD